eukprot:2790304-Pleurochrysis_carterae.AAC.5
MSKSERAARNHWSMVCNAMPADWRAHEKAALYSRQNHVGGITSSKETQTACVFLLLLVKPSRVTLSRACLFHDLPTQALYYIPRFADGSIVKLTS